MNCEGSNRLVELNGERIVLCLKHANDKQARILSYISSRYECEISKEEEAA